MYPQYNSLSLTDSSIIHIAKEILDAEKIDDYMLDLVEASYPTDHIGKKYIYVFLLVV